MAVCPRPETPPVMTAPVAEVVPAAGVGFAGPVTDLIPTQARRGQRLLGLLIAVGHHVVVRREQLAAPDTAGQPGTVLDGQGVRAHVIGSEFGHGIQARLPVLIRFARRAVDEIKVDMGESRLARPADHVRYPPGGMPAVKCGKHV